MTAAMTASVERTSVVEPHLRILHTVAQAVSGSLDVDEVLRTALDALTHVTGHEMSSLHLLSEDGQQLHLQGERLLSPMLREVNVLLPVGKGQLGGVAKTGVTLVLKNAADDPSLLPQARVAMATGVMQQFPDAGLQLAEAKMSDPQPLTAIGGR